MSQLSKPRGWYLESNENFLVPSCYRYAIGTSQTYYHA